MSTINANLLTKIHNIKINETNVRARGYSNNEINFLGECILNLKYNGMNLNHKFLVVDGDNVSLLGRDLCSKLNFKLKVSHNNKINTVKSNILKKYDTFLSDKFESSVRSTVSLTIDNTARPIFSKARPVPLRYKDKVCDELQRLENSGIIKRVLSSEWSSPVVNVMRKNGKIRICGDYSKTINKHMTVAQYPLPSIESIMPKCNSATCFSKIDLQTAFLQLPLDEESQKLTTINTCNGLYIFKYLPFGTNCSPAIFQSFLCDLLGHIESVIIYQDDILIVSKTIDDHDKILDEVLNTLMCAGLKINVAKCEFYAKSVSYLGYVLDKSGMHPCADKITAILKAPAPSNMKELQSFIGLCNYYNKFIPNFSHVFRPLYDLLKKDIKFVWGRDQEYCFEFIKNLFKSDKVLRHFDTNRLTAIECDASQIGIGGALLQKYGEDWHPVMFVSRSLNAAEKNYSQIEREALSIIFTCEKFNKFLLGGEFIIKNDHLPLRKLFGSDSSVPVNCSSRIQRWALRLSQFKYKFEFIKGKDNNNADFLSRFPLKETNEINEPYALVFLLKSLDNLPLTCEHIKNATDADENLLKLKNYILNGFPDKLDKNLKKFQPLIDELSILKGCIMYRDRVYVPESIRDEVLSLFHEGHPGMSAMKQSARSLIWYHGMDKEIETTVKKCNVCQVNQSKPAKSNLTWPLPDKKWSRLHIDHFFFEGYIFLVVIDALTKYIECLIVNSVSSISTIEALREIFSR